MNLTLSETPKTGFVCCDEAHIISVYSPHTSACDMYINSVYLFRTLVKSAQQKFNFLISQPKHVVGTQKNRHNETVLLNTQQVMLKLMGKKILTILR